MPLTDTAIRAIRPLGKPQHHFDRDGLFLLVTPRGGRWWRFKYRFGGKSKLLSLGVYPEVSLKDARARRDEYRVMLNQGIDPGEVRKAAKVPIARTVDQFDLVVEQWHKKMAPSWSANHAALVMRRLERDVLPALGGRSIKEIRAPDVLVVLQRMEERGVGVSAHRVRQIIGQVFRYAMACGLVETDPTYGLRGALAPVQEEHHGSITNPEEVGRLLVAIDGYGGSAVVRCALRLAPLVFVRPGELRHAEWVEINMDAAEWRIPGAKMKMKSPHIVPMSRQALQVLGDLQRVTGDGRFLFPSTVSSSRPMSENTVTTAILRMGYARGEMTGHGFRSMASTLLNEQGWHRDAIERQLAHSERDSVRAAYNYAEHLPERRRMMQAWADYLDGLKANCLKLYHID